MALNLCISVVLLLAATFTIGDACDPCDAYTDPTSPLSVCGLKLDPSMWARMYQDCKPRSTDRDALRAHFNVVLTHCQAKGVNLNIDFTVCPPVNLDVGCSVCDELTRRVGGIKACADALPSLIWGSLIIDCNGYEERGDVDGRNDLVANLEAMCKAKGKPISFDCPITPTTPTPPPSVEPEEVSPEQMPETLEQQFPATQSVAPQSPSVQPSEVPPETDFVLNQELSPQEMLEILEQTTQLPTPEPACDRCDFSASPCYQQMSDQIQSAVVKDCSAVVNTDGYDSLLANLDLICEAKGENAIEISCGIDI